MKKKPIHENEDDHSNAFEDDDPDFEFGNIGPKHKLILNKFSILRPQFVLPTIEFEPQSEPLNIVDFRAVWNVLSALGSKYMAIYNCGLEAGASVPHKHLQIFPQANHLDEKPFSDIQKGMI